MGLPTNDVSAIPAAPTQVQPEAGGAPPPPPNQAVTAAAPQEPAAPAAPAAPAQEVQAAPAAPAQEVQAAPAAQAPAAPAQVPTAPDMPGGPGTNMAAPASAGSGMVSALEAAKAMGFEGLDLSGFGAFPMVRLYSGSYNTRDGIDFGKEFFGYIQDGGTKSKYVYNNGLADKDPNRAYFYTYDQVHTTNGAEVTRVLDDWSKRGWVPQISPYLDTMVKVHGGQHDGTLILLSVPKTSISRITAHIGEIFQSGTTPANSLTRFGIAAQVGSGSSAFFPMDFSRAG